MPDIPARDALEQILPKPLFDAIAEHCPNAKWEVLQAMLQSDQGHTMTLWRAMWPAE